MPNLLTELIFRAVRFHILFYDDYIHHTHKPSLHCCFGYKSDRMNSLTLVVNPTTEAAAGNLKQSRISYEPLTLLFILLLSLQLD